MGKRMRPHTLTTAKPLIPIAGKPIVQRLVEDIILTCNEKIEHIAFIIAPTFGKETEDLLLEVAANLNAKGVICYQEEALGTAHAILAAKEYLTGNVIVALADTLIKANFQFDKNKEAIIWTQKIPDPSQFGVVKLQADGTIEAFIEKPKTFVSDLAIIGIYYFKDGDNLRNELQYLIDHDIKVGIEYQLTTAMENMRAKGLKFYSEEVEEWLDCGNKDATVYTNQRILEIKQHTENLIPNKANFSNTIIIEPCYIAEDVIIKNSIIGPHVSLEKGCNICGSIITNSIIREETNIQNSNITNSLIGKATIIKEQANEHSLGDYSTIC